MTKAPDPGTGHLVWILRFQAILWAIGIPLWMFRSGRAALVFGVGGLASLAFWQTHRWLVGRMLTPSVRLRWFYGLLSLLKLALIAGVLRAMMTYFPTESIPLSVGVLLFVGAILLEAGRLVLRPGSQDGS